MRNPLRFPRSRSQHGVQGKRREPKIDLLPERTQVHSPRPILAREMNVVPHPVDIDGGIDAIVLEQGNGHAGNGGSLHVRKGALEDAQAAHPDNRLNFAGLNQGHHNGRTLRHQHCIPQPLRFQLEILDRTKTALLAEKAELVKGSRTLAFNSQTLGQQQQTPLVRHRCERLPPQLVVDQNPHVVAVHGIHLQMSHQTIRVFG